MPAVELLRDINHKLAVASNRKIYDVFTSTTPPAYANGYQNRSLWTVGKTFVPAALPNNIVRFSLTAPEFKLVSSGGTLQNQWSFAFTDFSSTALPFEIVEHNTATGFIVGSFRADLSSTANTSGYVYFNNPGVLTSQENRTALNQEAIASWHLPNKLNFKPGVLNGDFNNDFSSTTGLRGAAANFANTALDNRTVRSDLLNGLSVFSVEFMFYLNHLNNYQQMFTIPSIDLATNTEFAIRTHNSPEVTIPVDGLRTRIVGASGDANYNYRSVDLVINRWYHAVIVFNFNGTQTLYLDGDLITRETDSDTSAPGLSTYSTPSLYIGGHPGDTTHYVNGRMDDIVIIGGTISADSAKWRARNLLYPDSSFTMASMEAPGTANDNMAGIYFDINNSNTFIVNLNDYLISPAGRTVSDVSIASPPASGEGSVTKESSTSVKYTPPTNFSGTPDFTLNVSTS